MAVSARGGERYLLRWAVLPMLVLATLSNTYGCAPQPQDCAAARIQCAGLVTDFGPVDVGLSRQAWLALLDARADGLLDRVDFIETVDTRDREANIATFAKNGYDIIVTVGPGISDETASAAARFPSLQFVGVQQLPLAQQEPVNLVKLVFPEDQGGFLAGAVASLVTSTRHVAAVCEAVFIDWVRSYCEGFRAGAEFVDPDIHVDVIFRGGSQDLLFRDTEWGRATAERELAEGADVVFSAGKETAEAALTAAAEHGALVIGAETDLYTELPAVRPQLVTSAILDVRSGVLALLGQAVQDGLLSGEYAGSVGLAPFHEFESRMAPEAIIKLQGIERGLETDAIRVDLAD